MKLNDLLGSFTRKYVIEIVDLGESQFLTDTESKILKPYLDREIAFIDLTKEENLLGRSDISVVLEVESEE